METGCCRASAQASFTARATTRAVAKAEASDPTVRYRTAEAQRIKVTPGITGLSGPSVHSDGPVWHLDVGSSHPGGEEAPKGLAVRQLKRYASWVQNVVRQFGLLSATGAESCAGPSLVREDREGRTSILPVVVPTALPGSYVRFG